MKQRAFSQLISLIQELVKDRMPGLPSETEQYLIQLERIRADYFDELNIGDVEEDRP